MNLNKSDNQKINKTVKIGNNIVSRYNIIDTSLIVYEAYEPTMPFMFENRPSFRNHATFMEFGGRYYGRIGTRRTNDHEDQYARAYQLINDAFPETVSEGRRSHGEITIIIDKFLYDCFLDAEVT